MKPLRYLGSSKEIMFLFERIVLVNNNRNNIVLA